MSNYDLKSLHAENFINHEEIIATIDFAKANMTNKKLLDDVLDKANDRKGGVGKETTIISEEVYEEYDQRKFIPVFMEPSRLLPTYLKTRFAVDLNDGNQDGYTDLIGAIFDVNKKPLLGPINYELLAKARN